MIIKNNEEALRVKCEEVTPEEAGELIKRLESELAYSASLGSPGIGLAAPQIGIAKKAAIVRLGKPEYNVNLINCSISQGWDMGTFEGEGCLSFPGRIETTNRYQEILIENNLVMPKRMTLTGLFAVAAQHEIGHFNQDLFIDHIAKKKKIRPNDICPCGTLNLKTGNPLKYKKCCGKK